MSPDELQAEVARLRAELVEEREERRRLARLLEVAMTRRGSAERMARKRARDASVASLSASHVTSQPPSPSSPFPSSFPPSPAPSSPYPLSFPPSSPPLVSASQEPLPVPEGKPFALELQKPGKRPRKQSLAEAVYTAMENEREERCADVGEEFIPERWDYAKINTVLGKVAKDTDRAKELHSTAWRLYLADDGNRVRKPAWSIGYYMSPGVRARYETDAARLEEGDEAADG